MKEAKARVSGEEKARLWERIWGENRSVLLKIILSAALGGAFSLGRIAGSLSPFGYCFTCAMPGKYSVFSALGAIICYLAQGSEVSAARYIAQILVVLAIKWAFSAFLELGHRWTLPLISAVVNLSVGAVMLFTRQSSVYDVFLLISECVLCVGAVYFLEDSAGLLQKGEGLKSAQSVVSVSVAAALLMLALSRAVVGVLSVGGVLAVYVVMALALSVGTFGGACAGLSIGAALSLSAASGGFYALALGLGGMLSGLFSKMSRYAVVFCFLSCSLLAIAISGAQIEELYFLYESLSASVLFILTPEKLFKTVFCYFPSSAEAGDAYPNKYLASKLNFVAQSLEETSQSICEMSQRLTCKSGDTFEVFSSAADTVCRRCSSKLACWDTCYTDTMDSFNHLITPLKENGRIEPQNVPDYLRQRCLKLPSLIAQINAEYYRNCAESQNALRLRQIKEVMTGQFSGVSRLLCEMSQELSLTMCDRQCESKITRQFIKQGITASDISCPVDKFGRRAVEFYSPREEIEKFSASDLEEIMTDICGAPMYSAGVVNTQELSRLTFSEKTPFFIKSGAFQKCAQGEEVCGDSFDFSALGGGFFAAILSDGMGQGKSAALDSRLTLTLVSKFLKLGFSLENTVSLVNSALQIKSEEETLSTLDVTIFDLYSGGIEIKKSGAAPSFIKRGRRVSKVEIGSLPLGILKEGKVRSVSLKLSRGDIVVMCSDGLCALSDNEIEGILKKSEGLSPEQIARSLGEKALAVSEGKRRDDITVLVAQIV